MAEELQFMKSRKEMREGEREEGREGGGTERGKKEEREQTMGKIPSKTCDFLPPMSHLYKFQNYPQILSSAEE